MGILNEIEGILPSWMLKTPRRHYAGLMGTFAATLDALQEAVQDARTAALPGQLGYPGEPTGGFDDFTALPVIARDRGPIQQGLLESPFMFAADLRAWLDLGQRRATAVELLERFATILSPDPPLLRIIGTDGSWWTRYPVPDLPNGIIHGGTIELLRQGGDGFQWDPVTGAVVGPIPFVPHLFDWDSLSAPPTPLMGAVNRFFLVVYVPCNLPLVTDTDRTFADPGTCGDFAATPGVSGAGPSPFGGTIGTNAARRWIDLTKVVVNEWRAMGPECDHMILTFDPASFNPLLDSTPTSVPDGKQGWHSWYDSALNERVPHRFPNARYVPGSR